MSDGYTHICRHDSIAAKAHSIDNNDITEASRTKERKKERLIKGDNIRSSWPHLNKSPRLSQGRQGRQRFST